MSRSAPLGVVLLISGCAANGVVAPPDPLPPSGGLNVEVECAQALRLAEVGEHKPAVDSLRAVQREGGTCAPAVLEAVRESEQRLADADELARAGLAARNRGEFSVAEKTFRLALVAYPKYYWVQKLARDLDAVSSGELRALRERAARELSSGRPTVALELLQQAAQLPGAGADIAEEIARVRANLVAARLGEARGAEQAGDLSEAVEKTELAMAAQPAQPIVEEVVEHARRLGLKLFATGELVRARDLWAAALEFDQGNRLLREYIAEVEARLRNLDAIKDGGS